MDGIGRKVNWKCIRAWKDGNRFKLFNDSTEYITKDNSYAEARVDYAASLIASTLQGYDDQAACIKEA